MSEESPTRIGKANIESLATQFREEGFIYPLAVAKAVIDFKKSLEIPEASASETLKTQSANNLPTPGGNITEVLNLSKTQTGSE